MLLARIVFHSTAFSLDYIGVMHHFNSGCPSWRNCMQSFGENRTRDVNPSVQ